MLGWGNVPVGTSATETLLVFNFGSATLSLGHIAVSGKEFALNGKFDALPVEPGHTATLEVIFSPTETGAETGILTFITNDQSHPDVAIALSATGVQPPAPGVLVTPASLAFGNVPVGTKSTLPISIENTGDAALSIHSLTTNGKGFTVIGPSTSAAIAPGASISVAVILAPTATGSSSGNVSITTNASASPIVIPLTGTAVAAAPILSVSATSISFGDVLLGAIGSQSVRLTNSGTANLVISKLGVSGTSFTVNGLTTPATLPPGQSAAVTVNFVPLLALAMNGSLAISSNATNSATETIGLSGSGISVATRSVKLSWSPSVSANIVGYNIYRSTVSGGPYGLVSGPISGTTFTDANVVAGQTYYYVLSSVDRNGLESAYSAQAAVTVPGS